MRLRALCLASIASLIAARGLLTWLPFALLTPARAPVANVIVVVISLLVPADVDLSLCSSSYYSCAQFRLTNACDCLLTPAPDRITVPTVLGWQWRRRHRFLSYSNTSVQNPSLRTLDAVSKNWKTTNR